MLKNRKLFLNKFIIAKDEFVSMKLHFRYHRYLYSKKGEMAYDGCKYSQDKLVNINGGLLASKMKTMAKEVKQPEKVLYDLQLGFESRFDVLLPLCKKGQN